MVCHNEVYLAPNFCATKFFHHDDNIGMVVTSTVYKDKPRVKPEAC